MCPVEITCVESLLDFSCSLAFALHHDALCPRFKGVSRCSMISVTRSLLSREPAEKEKM